MCILSLVLVGQGFGSAQRPGLRQDHGNYAGEHEKIKQQASHKEHLQMKQRIDHKRGQVFLAHSQSDKMYAPRAEPVAAGSGCKKATAVSKLPCHFTWAQNWPYSSLTAIIFGVICCFGVVAILFAVFYLLRLQSQLKRYKRVVEVFVFAEPTVVESNETSKHHHTKKQSNKSYSPHAVHSPTYQTKNKDTDEQKKKKKFKKKKNTPSMSNDTTTATWPKSKNDIKKIPDDEKIRRIKRVATPTKDSETSHSINNYRSSDVSNKTEPMPASDVKPVAPSKPEQNTVNLGDKSAIPVKKDSATLTKQSQIQAQTSTTAPDSSGTMLPKSSALFDNEGLTGSTTRRSLTTNSATVDSINNNPPPESISKQ